MENIEISTKSATISVPTYRLSLTHDDLCLIAEALCENHPMNHSKRQALAKMFNASMKEGFKLLDPK